MKNRLAEVRALIDRLCEQMRMPGSRAAELRGTIASVTVRRNGGVAVTIYLLPIDRSATTEYAPGTPVTLSK
jgi:hypothetical protein